MSTITAGSPTKWLEDIFADYKDPHPSKGDTFPKIILNVIVAGTAFPPRHEKWEYIRSMGSAYIEHVLYHKSGLPEGDLIFIFPDNHMVPAESQQFVHKLYTHPEVAKSKTRRRVIIVTNQPYIVGDCLKEQVRMLQDGGELFKKLNAKG